MRILLFCTLLVLFFTLFGLYFFDPKHPGFQFSLYLHLCVGFFLFAVLGIYLPEHIVKKTKTKNWLFIVSGWVLVFFLILTSLSGFVWFLYFQPPEGTKNLHQVGGILFFVVSSLHIFQFRLFKKRKPS